MVLKDKFGSKITITQARSGAIIIPFGNRAITLSKEDAETFSLYDIEDFDKETYNRFYK